MTSTKERRASKPATSDPTPPRGSVFTSGPRHARVTLDPKDPRTHMAMCGEGYPWPSTIALEPSRTILKTHPEFAFTRPVTCRPCVLAIEARKTIPFPIPANSSDH